MVNFRRAATLEELAKSADQYSNKTQVAATETNQLTDRLGLLRKGFDATKIKLGEIAEGVGGLSTRFTELNQAAELAGKVLGTLGNIGGFLGDQIAEVGAFELALAQVEVRTKATAEESRQLRTAIADALQTSAVSAGAAADALRLMAEDGASATEAAQNLGQAVAYAQANTRALSDTVQGLGAVLDVFNEGPEKIGALADSITATAAAAGTSTKAIEDGLAGVGIAAEQAGLSLDETVALIGTLAQRGVEGGRAGAQLTKVLQQLADPATKAGEALKTAGIDGSDLSGVLQRLATDSSLAEEVLSALGAKPRAALKLLLADGGKSLEGFTEAVRNASGASQEASDILGDKFKLAMDRAAASIENARNTFLEPILEPLAQELNRFATDFNTFAQTPEFERLREQFTKISTEGIQALSSLARSFDFEGAITSLVAFSEAAADNFQTVIRVASLVGSSIATVYDTVQAGGAGLVEAFTGVLSDLTSVLGYFNEDAAELSRVFGDMSANARELSDEALARLASRFGLTAEEAQKFGNGLGAVATKAQEAKLDLDELAKALPKNDIAAIAQRWGLLVKPLQDIGGAATEAGAGLGKASAAATAAGIAFERMQVGVLLRAMDSLMRSGLQTSDTYKALNAQFLAAEGRINALTAEQQRLADETDGVTASANQASVALRNYGNAASEAADAASSTSSSNSQVSESFGNIGRQSSSVEVSLGNMTEAFTREAQAAAGATNSIRGYTDTWNAYVARAVDDDKRIAERIDQLQRQNSVLSEEDRIRRQLEQQYGNSSTRLEELVQLELRRLNARRESLQVGREEIEQANAVSQTGGQLEYTRRVAVDVRISADASAGGQTLSQTTLDQIVAKITPAVTRAVLDELRVNQSAAGF